MRDRIRRLSWKVEFAIVMGLAFGWTWMRGWTLARLGIRFSLRGCLQGAALALPAYGLCSTFAVLVGRVWPDVASALAATRLVGDALSLTAWAPESYVTGL